MDLESLGGGFGSGLVGAVLALLGINRRVNKLEDNKQDKKYCETIHKAVDEKFILMIDMQKEIRKDIKEVHEHMMNRRKGYD